MCLFRSLPVFDCCTSQGILSFLLVRYKRYSVHSRSISGQQTNKPLFKCLPFCLPKAIRLGFGCHKEAISTKSEIDACTFVPSLTSEGEIGHLTPSVHHTGGG